MKRKDKGFTLIELLGILIILAVIAVISFVVIDKVIKSGREKMYNQQLETIVLGAKNWLSDNLVEAPINTEVLTVNLGFLKKEDYLAAEISDPRKNGICFANETEIEIKKTQETYTYDVINISFNNCENELIPDNNIVYQYEYQLVIEEGYSDWSEWSEWSTTEVTATDTLDVKTKEEYEQTGTQSVKKTSSYYTDAGWEKCFYSASVNCPSGYEPDGTGRCLNISDYCAFNPSATYEECVTDVTYSCPNGGIAEGDICMSSCAFCTSGTLTDDYRCKHTSSYWVDEPVYGYVTYYSYCTREYTPGTIKIEWSSSNNDESLLSLGYTLTGNKKGVIED